MTTHEMTKGHSVPVVKGKTCYAGVVKRWECDLNGHMNVQFFLRAFHQASAVCAQALGGGEIAHHLARQRIHRFCHEIFCPEAYSIETFRLRGGVFDGWIVHLMLSSDRTLTYATAVEPAGPYALALPELDALDLVPILPRSFTGASVSVDPTDAETLGLGITLPREIDHLGHVPVYEQAGRMAAASHLVFERMGLSHKRIAEDKINRFMLEMRYTCQRPILAGTRLQALNILHHTEGQKVFVIEHHLLDAKDGGLLGSFESLMAIADLQRRKLIALPPDMAEFAQLMNGIAIT